MQDPLFYAPRRDYYGVTGGRNADVHGWRGDVFTDGVFYINSFTRTGKITDGLSRTMAAGESVHYARWGWGDGYGDENVGGPCGWVFGSACAPESNGTGQVCRVNSMSVGRSLRSTKLPMNSSAYPIQSDETNEIPFGSSHPGGTQFVFCDGHVEFLDDYMDMDVYQSLSTRAGGEVVFE